MRLLQLILASVCLFLPSLLIAQIDANADAWTPLFNGKNLQDWTPKITGQKTGQDPRNTFRVDQGLLKVRYDEYERFAGQFGHLFYDVALSHYALHVEYRFVGEQLAGGPAGWAVRNSGVMLHAQAPDTMSLKQDFPTSIEAQLLGGLSNGQPRPTANVCTPGTDISVNGQRYPQHCLASESATFDGDQWVNVTVVVLGGGSIRHYVNGTEVLRYERPTLGDTGPGSSGHEKPGQIKAEANSLNSGYIALQSESHPIDFRQIRLLNLAGCTDAKAINFAPYYVKSIPSACRY